MTLKIEDLSVSFPTGLVLDGVSFSLDRGEVVGMTGSSGAGKSIVAEALVGALPPDAIRAGRITVDGAPLVPRTIALAPQRLDALDPLAQVGRQLERFARLADRSMDVLAVLAGVGLPARTARLYPHELSGGMARRVLLATALATGADWIVADEPTVGLDDAASRRILSLLADLAASGHGVIVISHDLIGLAKIAARVVILRQGRHVETASASVFTGPGADLREEFSRALWQAQLAPASPC
ncbi:ATP-binding cassette domain-containing protein [Pelagovum pacificum]|uniref:ABC transporter ATP-binding protein n=1 Tax=Pelagovum pacificum TaxID=2588711 RepID=A0A5C5G831_9RHOB|nr:ATP-binding cassette domain-containing protein [Pelagovum pacificum]QQA41566.1 ABC transporter ATP-binding protein [Pelagovum pacificum]TNY30846.1 ABC transporter ATP-binding protein [Pelagovum pacificum]